VAGGRDTQGVDYVIDDEPVGVIIDKDVEATEE
jgi:hypothetical protein